MNLVNISNMTKPELESIYHDFNEEQMKVAFKRLLELSASQKGDYCLKCMGVM